MTLWGAEVKPGQEYVHKFSREYGRLRITREEKWLLNQMCTCMKTLEIATLGSQKNLGSSTLQGRVGQERQSILCSLNPMSKTTCSLELEVEEEKDVTFSVDGPNFIHLSWFYIDAKAPTCTITRPTLLKRTHQEIAESGNKKSRREDGTGDELNEEETDGTQKSNVTPPPPVRSENKVAKKASISPANNEIHEISNDDEKETPWKDKGEASLKLKEIIEGRSDGKIAADGDKVSINFVGRFKKNGEVFHKGESFQFKLGTGKVIRGLNIGIKGMKVGEERELTIPPSLGYGGTKLEEIPVNSWLIYKITLLEVEQPKRTKKGSKDA